jgi:hypothetical protein
LNEIYASRKANVKKGGGLYITIQAATNGVSTHSETDHSKHAFRRRVLDNAFSDRALRTAEPFIHDNIKIWCMQLGAGDSDAEGWTKAKNMSVWNSYLGYDIMGDLAFSKRFQCLEQEENRYIPPILVEGNGLVYSVSFLG